MASCNECYGTNRVVLCTSVSECSKPECRDEACTRDATDFCFEWVFAVGKAGNAAQWSVLQSTGRPALAGPLGYRHALALVQSALCMVLGVHAPDRAVTRETTVFPRISSDGWSVHLIVELAAPGGGLTDEQQTFHREGVISWKVGEAPKCLAFWGEQLAARLGIAHIYATRARMRRERGLDG